MKIDLAVVELLADALREELSKEMTTGEVPHVLGHVDSIVKTAASSARALHPAAPPALMAIRDLLAPHERTANTKAGLLPLRIYFAYLGDAERDTDRILRVGLNVAVRNAEWKSYVRMWRKRTLGRWNFLCLRVIGLCYLLGWSSPACIAACERRAVFILNLIYRETD
jgi:hypothetical protein